MKSKTGTDVEVARRHLQDHSEVKVVAVKDDRVLGSAEGRGIRPLLELVDRLGQSLEGAAVADRIIGRAAAFILIDAKVTAAYGETLSTEAEKLLLETGIQVGGQQRVPYILRPDGVERCLMEQQVMDVESPAEAVQCLREFLMPRGS